MNIITWICKSEPTIEGLFGVARGVVLLTLLILFGSALPSVGQIAPAIDVKILSSRPDVESGGDALVQITGQTESQKLSIWEDGREVTDAFHVSPRTQTLIGLVQGLVVGENHLEVRSGRKVLAHLKIIGHEISGPIFSGPHQAPFICETQSAGLGEPLDTDCSIKTQVTYIYKSTQPPAPAQLNGPPAGFKVYDPSAPQPTDIAEVTTTQGKKVRYIVRWEKGTINRALYQIAFLHEPGTPLPDPWTSTPGWNGRLVYNFEGGCAAGYHQGHAIDGVDNLFLAFGYAEVTSSLNVLGNNCNDVLSAETAVMVKEHFVKNFGVPVHTIGWGGSGGSIQQYLIAQNYPGLLDGIIPSMSFPDVVSILPGIVDCTLFGDFFKKSTQTWTDGQKTAVSGFATWGTCSDESDSWMKWFSPQLVTATSCNEVIPTALVYNSAANRKGARCDFYDNEINIFGPDRKTGFARRALDTIGAEQFLELNAKIGGYDVDGNVVSSRMAADLEALRIAYASGRVNSGSGGLGSIPIIDVRRYGDLLPDIHDEYRSFITRARLIGANGNADNQVILTFPYTTKPSKNFGASFAFVASTLVPKMDQWLDALDKDDSKRSMHEKIAAARPEDITDACWTNDGERIAEKRAYEGNSRCNQLYPPHGDPRIVAGSSIKEDVLKCKLKPIDPADYTHPLSPDQVTHLKGIFPSGVCNYSVPGVGQGPLQGTWGKY
jgi:hypothetical protein